MSFAKIQPCSKQLTHLELFEKIDPEKIELNSPFETTCSNMDNFLSDEKRSDDDENFFEDMLESILNNQNDRSNVLSKSQESLNENKCQTQVVQVNEDDIIDERSVIKKYFQAKLIEEFECRYDSSLGLFTPKCTKLSKSLQRKLVNFYQLLDQYQMNQPNFDNPEGNIYF